MGVPRTKAARPARREGGAAPSAPGEREAREAAEMHEAMLVLASYAPGAESQEALPSGTT
jgi:F420-dependent methylenetetrahydromethanopterin dehydrogenase